MIAVWKGTVIADSDETIVVENNHYFPREDVKEEYLEKSGNTYFCGWKGTAEYYNVVVGEDRNTDAAWVYPEPFDEALHVKDRIAFWRGVEVRKPAY